ncbi:ABC transporter substrate-binding protein [Sedimentitalea sp. XS_ASV28]|uniref:ABC transporter substrate-binding protein n=1 Tax=Sedimentitalea sp. XS_ASV28 TaxID=3241296 RepID=UPI003518E3B4
MNHTKSLVAALALLANGAMADEIRVLNWQGYGTDQDFATKPFEEATGTKVIHEYFNSEQEMLTKLRTNPGAYDVVLINTSFFPDVMAENLLQPIDLSKVPNYADVAPDFAANPAISKDGAHYGVPWAWGLTSIAVNTGVVKEIPTSIEVLWDPKYAGHVSIRDDALEAVQLAALATGQNINQIDDLDAVKEKLGTLMPQIRTFWGSENDWNQYMAAGEMDVASYWSGSAARSQAAGLPIEFVVPVEGAIGWLDALAVPATSENADAALAFINWMIDPAFYVEWDKNGAPASANTAAAAALPEEAFNRRILGNPEVAARVQFMAPVAEEDRKAYLELWQSLKAAQ